MRVTRKVFSEKLIFAVEERAFNEGYQAAKEDEEKKKKLGTAAKVGIGIAGTTAAVGGGLVAARKGYLGPKLQGKVGKAYEKLGEKLGIKSLVEKGEKARWESTVTEAEREKVAELSKKIKDGEPFDPEIYKGVNELTELWKTRDRVAESIQKRHQDAGKIVNESIEKIKANGKKIQTNDDKLDEIENILGSL